ncbi:hypothetical protein PGB90_005211 [Kerria lacca]
MLKIHKGLKKKKKDKKHKHKDGDDDLFSEGELERYRKEHQHSSGDTLDFHIKNENTVEEADKKKRSLAGDSDEWQKFKLLTAGIDNVLQKTQEDLDRIKSTSFFQRKTVPTSIKDSAAEQLDNSESNFAKSEKLSKKYDDNDFCKYDQKNDENDNNYEKEKKESDNEFLEEDDNIFNTSYIDAIESGELKLAYIPDSPTQEDNEFDPFDTSIAEKYIANLNPKKRYLNLGCAVQVLSGRADSAIVTKSDSTKAKRRIHKPVDLLLSSFDEGDSSNRTIDVKENVTLLTPPYSPPKTLLDEEPASLLKSSLTEIGISPSIAPVVSPALVSQNNDKRNNLEGIVDNAFTSVTTAIDLSYFEENNTALSFAVPKQDSVDSINDEFGQLAAESLGKKAFSGSYFLSENEKDENVNFENNLNELNSFNTSTAEKLILPEKHEIKQLVTELLVLDKNIPLYPSTSNSTSLLSQIEDDDFDPRADQIINSIVTQKDSLSQANLESNFQKNLSICDENSSSLTLTTIKNQDHYFIYNQEQNKKEDENHSITSPNEPLKFFDDTIEEQEDFDPFDTSYVVDIAAPL